jgi:hypothetical protein
MQRTITVTLRLFVGAMFSACSSTTVQPLPLEASPASPAPSQDINAEGGIPVPGKPGFYRAPDSPPRSSALASGPAGAREANTTSVAILLTRDERIFFRGKAIPLTQLAETLRRNGVQPGSASVLLRGESGVSYRSIIRVIDALRGPGVRQSLPLLAVREKTPL